MFGSYRRSDMLLESDPAKESRHGYSCVGNAILRCVSDVQKPVDDSHDGVYLE